MKALCGAHAARLRSLQNSFSYRASEVHDSENEYPDNVQEVPEHPKEREFAHIPSRESPPKDRCNKEQEPQKRDRHVKPVRSNEREIAREESITRRAESICDEF